MKIRYKTTIIISLFGILSIFILSSLFNMRNRQIAINNGLYDIQNLSKEVSLKLQVQIQEKVSLAQTIATTPLLKEALFQSNSELSSLNKEQRDIRINSLNQQWMNTNNINDPFIQNYMTNPLSLYLRKQQEIMPGVYGEIFVTNRYGSLVGTTAKLTTLAHAQKYWWIGSYNHGDGKIYIDDRGFDNSAEGYVLGIVVPIRDKDEITGILKCNVNIANFLKSTVEEYNEHYLGKLQIVRTGGLIVQEENTTPLSTQVPEPILELLKDNTTSSSILSINGVKQLIASSPIPITKASSEIEFGGKEASIDHAKGNKGEGWDTVIVLSEEESLGSANQTTRLIVYAGILYSLLSILLAFLLSMFLTNPIVKLAEQIKKLGPEDIGKEIPITSKDEIGSLIKSFNNMSAYLEETMVTRDKLYEEIEQRKKITQEKNKITIELKKASSNVDLLSNMIPICASCGKIRDDEGYWSHLDEYVKEHSVIEFSHGICPECSKKLYPELHEKED